MTSTTRVVRGYQIAYPTALEKEYVRQLTVMATQLQALILEYAEQYQISLVVDQRLDDVVDDLDQLIKAIEIAMLPIMAKVIQTLPKRFTVMQQFVERSVTRSLTHLLTPKLEVIVGSKMRATGPENIDLELLKKIWLRQNIKLIKNVSEVALNKISNCVSDTVVNKQSNTILVTKIQEIGQLTKKRARVIARDQIAKLKGELSRYYDLQYGFMTYEWSTCKDGAVRHSHQVLEGKICSWLDPTIYKNRAGDKWLKRLSIGGVLKHVGGDIMCRCTNVMMQEI